MRLSIRGEYPSDWAKISARVKAGAGHRCVRCHHPFRSCTGLADVCDDQCVATKGLHIKRGTITPDSRTIGALNGINYGVHHFDGDKSNCRWFNLMALCNSCHLTIQANVIPERPWLFEHSEWMRPYAAGYYAFTVGNLDLPREEVMRDIERFIAIGQPWLAEAV